MEKKMLIFCIIILSKMLSTLPAGLEHANCGDGEKDKKLVTGQKL
jgi:hypothetical protein